MALTDKQLGEITSELMVAEREFKPVEPLTDRFPEITIPEAYAIQMGIVNVRGGRREVVVGKKIGLTSQAMQDMFGVREPDYGHIFDTMVVMEGEGIATGKLIQPRIEGEICFLLQDDLRGPGVNAASVLAATAGVMPALEIVDSRIRDWKIKIQDTIADNASAAMVVLGGKITPVMDIDLRLVGMLLEKDGEVVATAAGAAVLGNPAQSVAWLANKLCEYGICIRAGEFVMSGSLTAAVPVKAGSFFRATFDRLGSVSARFV